MHSLVPLFFFVLIIMALCSLSFSTLVEEFRSTAYTSYNWLFLIFTNDNFDRLLPDSMLVNLSYLVFFFPAIYVGQRFLLSLIVGETYDTFRSYVKKQLKKENIKEMQGLTKAFSALDDRKCGTISELVFSECLTCLHPELSEEAIALYFELLAGGGAGQNGVNILQFLSLRRVLSFQMSVIGGSSCYQSFLQLCTPLLRFYRSLTLPIGEKYSQVASQMLGYLLAYGLLDTLNLLDIVVFSLGLSDFTLLPTPYTPTLCQIIALLYGIEFMLRLAQHAGAVHKVSYKSNLVSLGFIGGCIGTSLLSQSSLVYLGPTAKLLVLCRLLRCLRIANFSSDLRDFTSAIMDILPVLSETFLFTFIVTYIFGALGHLLFGPLMAADWGTPTRAIVKAHQLTFMVSYLDSMEDAMATIHPVCIVYFLSYLVISLTVSNIALSIIIDLYGTALNANSKKTRDKAAKKLKLVFDKIVAQARVRRLFCASKSALNFKHISLSEFQTSDVRHFIAGADTDKELNLGTLYSNILSLVQQQPDIWRSGSEMHTTHHPSHPFFA